MTPSEKLIHSTIRIQCYKPEGISTGTGFFFCFSTNVKDTYIPVIVTNKHVVDGAFAGSLVFSLCDDKGNYLPGKTHTYNITNFENSWIGHPEEDVDLCVFPISQFYNEYRPNPYQLYMTCWGERDIPNEKEIHTFSHVEEITIVGYPDGLFDDKNNLPLVRRGITASSLQYDFRGEPNFIMDAAIFGGSSGSPVFLYNEGAFKKDENLMFGTRTKLVGINRAVFLHPVTGEITEIQPVKTSLGKTSIRIPNGLGIAIHARKLLDFKTIL